MFLYIIHCFHVSQSVFWGLWGEFPAFGTPLLILDTYGVLHDHWFSNFPLAVEALDAGTVDDVLGHHSGGARFHLGHLRADWCEEERGLAASEAEDGTKTVMLTTELDMLGCADSKSCMTLYDLIWPEQTDHDRISSSYCDSRIAQNMKYCVTIMCNALLICQNMFKYTMRTDPARARTCMDAWTSHICHDKRPLVSFQDSSSSIQTSGARTQCSIEPQQGFPDPLWFRPTVRSYCLSMYFLVLVVLVGLVVFCLGQGVMLFVLIISYLQVLSPFLSPGISEVDPKRILLTSWKSARLVLSCTRRVVWH